MNIEKETLEEMTHIWSFYQTYDLLEILSNFKPKLRPLIRSEDKLLNREIIKEWFELAIWLNRLIAYRESQRLELIENSIILISHLNNIAQRPEIHKAVDKLRDLPFHMAFHLNFMYLRVKSFNFHLIFI